MNKSNIIKTGAIILFAIFYISQIETLLGEDAMISMRYAYNLVNHGELVWNLGEYVQGYTNLGWVLIMAMVHLFQFSFETNAIIIQVLNLAVMIGIMAVLKDWIAWGLVAISGCMYYWGIWGFESNLQALLILIGFFSKRNMLIWIALAFVVRADTMILFFAMIFFADNKRELIIGSLIMLSVFAFQYFYYGDLLPNTFHLKSDGSNGLEYFSTFLFGEFIYLPVFIGAMFYIFKNKDAKAVVLIGIWVLMIVFFTGEDAFPYGRFFIPIIPLLAYYFAKFYREYFKHTVVIIFVIIGIGIHLFARFQEVKTEDKTEYFQVIEVLKTMPEDYLIGTFYAGIIPYYLPEYRFHDMLGKSDKHIARTLTKGGRIGHSKWDYEYSIDSLKPEVIVTASNWEGYTQEYCRNVVGSDYAWQFHPALYIHPTFFKRYEYVGNGGKKLVYKLKN